MKVVVLDGQSLVDISIQVYGSAEGVFNLAHENGLEVTDILKPGQVLEYSTGNVIAKNIAQYFTTKRFILLRVFHSIRKNRCGKICLI